MNIEELTSTTILEREIFEKIMSVEDEFDRMDLIEILLDKAKELGVKERFRNKLAAIKKMRKQELAEARRQNTSPQSFQNWTKFDGLYEPLFCGNWVADNDGVRGYNMLGEYLACYHPIMPIKRLVSLETGKEKVVIAFNKDGYWVERIFDKSTISSASKIQALSDFGVSVTSENAKYLVKYLNDIENMNIGVIEKQESTSKMGWFDNYNKFMPYCSGDIVFDGESRFQGPYTSISQKGDREKYIQCLKQIRKRDRLEPMLCVAVSLASVLVKPCGVLPFIFHLFGDAGKGKTVATLLATSIWGDPNEGGFMADPKSSSAGLEAFVGFLNNLPFILDDMSKLKKHLSSNKHDDFSEFIYFLCSGTGKMRSNVDLGVNKLITWHNCSITNGEKPITSEVSNGGELLRVIELKTRPGVIFDDGMDGKNTADFIRQNYGFLGKEFIDIIQNVGIDEISKIHEAFVQKIYDLDIDGEKEGKQIMPMALILTADKLFTDYIIKDGVYLDIDTCFKLIRSRDEMSDQERAYEFVLNEIEMHRKKFMVGDFEPEQRWGYLVDNDEVALINPNAFSGIAERGNFNKKMFVEWAVENGLSEVDKEKGVNRTTKKINRTAQKIKGNFVLVRLNRQKPKESGFIYEGAVSEAEQEKLPF